MSAHPTSVSARQAAGGRASSHTNASNRRTHSAAAAAADARYSAQPPPSSHPSLPLPYMGPGTPGVPADAHGARAVGNGVNGAGALGADWPHGQLEGPGMPPVRGFQHVSGTAAGAGDAGADAGVDAGTGAADEMELDTAVDEGGGRDEMEEDTTGADADSA